MTLFLNYRSDGQAGVVTSEPRLIETGLKGMGDTALWHKTPPADRWKNRHVLFYQKV